MAEKQYSEPTDNAGVFIVNPHADEDALLSEMEARLSQAATLCDYYSTSKSHNADTQVSDELAKAFWTIETLIEHIEQLRHELWRRSNEAKRREVGTMLDKAA